MYPNPDLLIGYPRIRAYLTGGDVTAASVSTGRTRRETTVETARWVTLLTNTVEQILAPCIHT